MAAKNFLTLVNDLRIEAAVSGRTLTTLQGTLPAEIERLKRWTAAAWIDIQNQHTDWEFLYVESSHILTAGDRLLDMSEFLAGDVAEWMLDSFRIADPGGSRKDSQTLRYLEYRIWRDADGTDGDEVLGKPQTFTFDPRTEAIMIAPAAATNYSLYYDYRRTPQELTLDDDVPIIPARYHDLITAWALKKYAFREAAPEVLASANEIIGRLFPALEIDQMPEVTLGTLGQ